MNNEEKSTRVVEVSIRFNILNDGPMLPTESLGLIQDIIMLGRTPHPEVTHVFYANAVFGAAEALEGMSEERVAYITAMYEENKAKAERYDDVSGNEKLLEELALLRALYDSEEGRCECGECGNCEAIADYHMWRDENDG